MDDGLLIEQVPSFPQLYVKTDPRYKSIRAKENAWKSIAVILEETPEECEHRWKILRNKYTSLKRKHKYTRSCSGASEITWPYFNSMKFLDPYLLTRKSFSYIKRKPKVVEWENVSQELPKENTPERSVEVQEGTSTSSPLQEQKTETLAEKMLGCLETFQKVLEPDNNHQEDSDEHFVKSLVQDLKVFSHREKIIIKREIYNVLVNHTKLYP